MTQTVKVQLAERSYDIVISDELISGIGAYLTPLLARNRVAVLVDEHVMELHMPMLEAGLAERNIAFELRSIASGERSKSWESLRGAVEWLIQTGFERQDLIIAFGGGVVGDLAGFAAAILRRGIRYVQLPTTLLAQVDSSVGGKTGINSSRGKNLIGTFHQPSLVLCDISILGTLPGRQLLAGYGEVAKYGLLGDESFFRWLERNGSKLVEGDRKFLAEAIGRSCAIKADIVAGDETEQGNRALLNLGHTFGHALETDTGFSGRLLHGEAVAIGCCLAFDLSCRLGLVDAEIPERVRGHFRSMGIMTDLRQLPAPVSSAETIVGLMAQDKKIIDGKPRFVLARGIGRAFVAEDVDRRIVRQVIECSASPQAG